MAPYRGAYCGFLRAYLGRTPITAGLREVITLALCELGLHRVEANIQPANLRSVAIVRRLGFEREGCSRRYLMVDGDGRDHERWALRAETFAA